MDKGKMLVIIFLAGMGIIFGSIGYAFLRHEYKIRKEYSTTTATIVEISSTRKGRSTKKNRKAKTYKVIVNYQVNNNTYQTNLGAYTHSMHTGKTITIHYNPKNPEKIAYSSFFLSFLLPGIFLLVGCAFLVVLFIFLFKSPNPT